MNSLVKSAHVETHYVEYKNMSSRICNHMFNDVVINQIFQKHIPATRMQFIKVLHILCRINIKIGMLIHIISIEMFYHNYFSIKAAYIAAS